jgi:integrase
VKLFSAEEVRRLVNGRLVVGERGPELLRAGVQLRAMILLGVNCGFGNADCGTLPLSAVDLETGWIDYARPKTGIARRCPFWPETVEALKEALAKRPTPKSPEHAGLFFIQIKAAVRKLVNGYQSQFKPAIYLPQGKGEGGYHVRIRRES